MKKNKTWFYAIFLFMLGIAFANTITAQNSCSSPSVITLETPKPGQTQTGDKYWYKFTASSPNIFLDFIRTDSTFFGIDSIIVYENNCSAFTVVNSTSRLSTDTLNFMELYLEGLTTNTDYLVKVSKTAYASVNYDLSFFQAVADTCNLVNNSNLDSPSPLCPQGPTPGLAAGTSLTNGWLVNGGSPDFFHSCATTTSNVNPNLAAGLIPVTPPAGYLGINCGYTGSSNQEYVTGTTTNMTAGQTYYIAMSYAKRPGARYAANHLGMSIKAGTTLHTGLQSGGFVPTIPWQITNPGNSMLTNTVFVTMGSCYQATGGENRITIGNTSSIAGTTYSLTNPSGGFVTSYYLIDNVTVTPLKLDVSPKDTICIGASTTLTMNIHCPLPAGVITNTAGAIRDTLVAWTPTVSLSVSNGTATVATPTATTIYTVVLTIPPVNSNGSICTITNTVQVVVFPKPTLTLTASPSTICAGSSLTLTATGADTYVWNPGSVPNSTMAVSPSTNTTYTATGTNTLAGCTNTAVISITVLPAVNLTASASPTAICSGSTSTLTASGATSYTWSPGGFTTAVVAVTPTVTTTYTVTGSNGICSQTKTVTVNVTTTPTVSISSSPSATVCSGNSATLTASGATTYSWNAGATSATIAVTPTTTTGYTVTGYNGSCTNTKTITITVIANVTLTAIANPTAVCPGSSSTLTAGGATSYTWNPGSLTSSTTVVTPTATTVYTVTGVSGLCSNTKTVQVTVNAVPNVSLTPVTSTVCTSQSITVSLTGKNLNSVYAWSTGATTPSISVSPSVTTVYSVTVTHTLTGCWTVKTATVYVVPVPTVSVGNYTICAGSTATVLASGANSYTWSTGANTNSIVVTPSVTTVYTVTGQNTGCVTTATNTGTVTVAPALPGSLTIITSSTSPVIANGTGTNVVNLSSSITNTTGLLFDWFPNGATTPTTALSLTQPEVVIFTVINAACGTSISQSICMNYVAQDCANSYPVLNNATITNTASLANGSYFVTGTLTIDWTTPIHPLEHKTFIMSTGSKVEITATSNVTFNSVNFYSCDGMWQGIELKTGASGSATLGVTSDLNSIEDAYRAIYSINPGGAHLNASIDVGEKVLLNKNYYDIYIENTNDASRVFPVKVAETRMFSQSTTNSPGGNLKCSSYYTPTVKSRSFAGLYAKNAGIVDFNSVAYLITDYNWIKNKDFGLYFDNTSANVNNVDFNSAVGAAYVYSLNLTSLVTGAGIYSKNSGFLKVGPATTPTTGITTNFTDLGYGVITNNTSVVDVQNATYTTSVQSNTIDPVWGGKPEWGGLVHYAGYGLNGVFVTNASDVLRVNNNTFYNNYYPVTANYTVAPNTSHIMSVAQNTMSTTGIGQVHIKEGVTVSSAISFTPTADNMRVAVNTFSNVTIGVKVNSTVSGLRISNNSIVTTTLQANQRGVNLINSSNVTVDNNSISSAYTGTNAGSYSTTNAGIFSENSPGCKIKCNTITQTGVGVQYMYGNSSPGDGLYGNTFTYPVKRGLWLSKGGLMGVQGNSVSASANIWSGFTNITGVDQTYVGGAFTGINPPSDAANSPLWVRNTATELPTDNAFFSPSVLLNAYNFGAFTLSPSAPTYTPGCPVTLTTGLRMAANAYEVDNSDRDNDFVNYIHHILPSSNTDFTPEDKFMLKQYMFGALGKDPSTNTELEDFYGHQRNTAIEDYHIIDSLLAAGNFNTAASQNAGALVDNDITQTQNAYNALYLNGINSAADMQNLVVLADLCPSQYGTAVYRARALLQTLTYVYKQYNDSCGRDKTGFRFNDEDEKSVSLSGGVQAKLFPNPNSGTFTLAYDLKTNAKATVTIMDVTGKMVYSSMVDNLNNRKQINTEYLHGGIYFIQLADDEKLLWTDKLIISK